MNVVQYLINEIEKKYDAPLERTKFLNKDGSTYQLIVKYYDRFNDRNYAGLNFMISRDKKTLTIDFISCIGGSITTINQGRIKHDDPMIDKQLLVGRIMRSIDLDFSFILDK